MPYYLCIDGGGPRRVRSPRTLELDRAPWRTFGLDECLAATREAVRNAIEALRNADPSAQIAFPYDGGVRFESVWAAYAGCTRQSDRDALLLPLQEMFGDVRLTGDGELLTAPAIGGPPHRFITLICGTGSLALLWDYNERAEQLARSGGWGPILDDAGSGWALGKEAIKSVLTFTANKFDLREWHCDILSHFGLHRTTGADRLISASSTLDPTKSPFEGDALRKKRIADCSRIVVKAAEGGDDEALRLLGVLADQVCSTLAPLVDVGKVREKETMIVVAGGLGQVQLFWRLVEDRFAKRGWRFRTIKMPEPGRSGLEALIK
ncbi:hypothetical protein CspHIS471_0105740 [Cutaneotrichosporon sp. HIS471]|nr:hypothetical protein CspHIS471_0105740 [Cutaneotrichosporon sp. HIS471]